MVVQVALIAGGVAGLAGGVAILLGGQPVDGRVEPVIRGLVAADRPGVGALDESSTVGGGGIAVATGVDAVDRRLGVAGRRVARLRHPVSRLGARVPFVGGLDQAAYLLVAGNGYGVPLVGKPVALVSDPVALIGDPVPFVRDAVAFVGHQSSLFG